MKVFFIGGRLTLKKEKRKGPFKRPLERAHLRLAKSSLIAEKSSGFLQFRFCPFSFFKGINYSIV